MRYRVKYATKDFSAKKCHFSFVKKCKYSKFSNFIKKQYYCHNHQFLSFLSVFCQKQNSLESTAVMMIALYCTVVFCGVVWLGSLTVTCRTCNPEVTERRRFDSAPGHCRVMTLGKLFTHICASVTKQYNLVPASSLGC